MPMQENPQHTLLFINVTAGYSPIRPVFNNSSFRLDGPALYHLHGKNGCGKSTFAELVSGYLKPTSGLITLNFENVQLPKTRLKRRICRSEPALFGQMTVRDHLTFACIAHHCNSQPQLQRAKKLGLEPWLDENADTLSTGNAQKLWYLISTTGQFHALVLDEPFNAIDKESAESIAAEILEASKTTLVIIITHTLPEVLSPAKTIEITDLITSTPLSANEKNISEQPGKTM